MKSKKCMVCGKPYELIQSRASRRNKQGRTSNAKYTCSFKCARIYDNLYRHLKYRFKKAEKKKQLKDEVGK